MRKSIYILILILFASTCFAGGVTDKVKSVIARRNAAAPSCSLGESASSGANGIEVGDLPIRYHIGQYQWQNASSRCICKVSFFLTKSAGDISSKTYSSTIHLVPTADFGTLLGTSANVNGNNSWSATEVEFAFSPCVTVDAATNIAITISPNQAADGSNYAMATYDSTGGTITGSTSRFTDSGNGGADYAPADMKMKIYWE